MEDLNMLAADCVVICCCCCCCQCLILQILVFALLKFPSKLVKKTREFAKRKLNRRRREMGSYIDEIARTKEEEYYGFRVEAERERAFVDDAGHSCGSCIEEVEKVMMEFHQKGEFAFGSFWGRETERQGPWGTVPAIKGSTNDDEDDDDFVKYQIIEMTGSYGCTSSS